MSTFYGSVQGNRGEATRGGSRASGIRASAQSWNGSVITELSYNNDDQLMVELAVRLEALATAAEFFMVLLMST